MALFNHTAGSHWIKHTGLHRERGGQKENRQNHVLSLRDNRCGNINGCHVQAPRLVDRTFPSTWIVIFILQSLFWQQSLPHRHKRCCSSVCLKRLYLAAAGTIPWISLMVFTHILMLLTLSEMSCMNPIADTVSPVWLQGEAARAEGRRVTRSWLSYNMPEHSQRFDFFWFPWILVTHVSTVSTCLFFFFYWCKFKMHHFLWRRVFPRKHADEFHVM